MRVKVRNGLPHAVTITRVRVRVGAGRRAARAKTLRVGGFTGPQARRSQPDLAAEDPVVDEGLCG